MLGHAANVAAAESGVSHTGAGGAGDEDDQGAALQVEPRHHLVPPHVLFPEAAALHDLEQHLLHLRLRAGQRQHRFRVRQPLSIKEHSAMVFPVCRSPSRGSA